MLLENLTSIQLDILQLKMSVGKGSSLILRVSKVYLLINQECYNFTSNFIFYLDNKNPKIVLNLEVKFSPGIKRP